MKKLSVLSLGLCAVLALASCGTSKESAYKKAYEKAQQQEQQAAQAPVAQEPVVAPLETQAPISYWFFQCGCIMHAEQLYGRE